MVIPRVNTTYYCHQLINELFVLLFQVGYSHQLINKLFVLLFQVGYSHQLINKLFVLLFRRTNISDGFEEKYPEFIRWSDSRRQQSGIRERVESGGSKRRKQAAVRILEDWIWKLKTRVETARREKMRPARARQKNGAPLRGLSAVVVFAHFSSSSFLLYESYVY